MGRFPEINLEPLFWLAIVGIVSIIAIVIYAIYFAVSHLRIV